jgi:inhibitor of KinA sporulation pathway (predicted exonuclease)
MRFVVIYDLEFTAWIGSMQQRWLAPGQFREIVQIGAVRLDAQSLAQTGEFEILIKPRLNPVLSPYLEDLTGIANADMARRGVDLANGLARFVDFVGGGRSVAFGRDDLVIADNLRLYGLKDAPAIPAYTNIAPWLRANGLDPKHAGDVAEAAGAHFTGRKHDALDDARSVALGIRTLVARGAQNPFLATAE